KVSARQQLACCIVDGSNQAQARSTAFEPVMATAIPQNHLAGLRTTIATLPILRRPASTHSLDADFAQNATNRRARDPQSFDLEKLLGEVLVVESTITLASQLNDPRANELDDAMLRMSACIAVQHSSRAHQRYVLADALHLASRYAE